MATRRPRKNPPIRDKNRGHTVPANHPAAKVLNLAERRRRNQG